MKPVRLLPPAEAEVAAAARWYEARQTGLGVDFVAEVDAAFDRIAGAPGRYPVWRADRPYRKAALKRFPYLVFYRLLDDEVEVVAVAHEKRRPGYWSDR